MWPPSEICPECGYRFRPSELPAAFRAARQNLRSCPDCGHLVSPAATACPECGCPFGAAHTTIERPWRPGCFTWVLLFGIIGIIAMSCVCAGPCSILFGPETPEQARRRKQREVAEAAQWEADEAKQPQRQEAIQALLNTGVFSKVEYRPQGATIWLGSAFYVLDFDMKQGACSIVHDYVGTNAKQKFVRLVLKDRRSGKTVGTYGLSGLEME